MSADHDAGFEQGALAAANTILAFLQRRNLFAASDLVRAAWLDGSIVETPVAPRIADTLLAPTDRLAAQQQGYTGDQCSHCNSMRMQVAGHCMVCADCGTTTGCS